MADDTEPSAAVGTKPVIDAPSFHVLASLVPETVLGIDLEERICFVDHAPPGVVPEQLVGLRLGELVSSGQREEVAAGFAALRGGATVHEQTLRIRLPSGALTRWQGRMAAIRGDAGLIGYLVVATDVTGHVRSTHERDRLFHLSHDLLCVATLEGDLLQVNRAFARVLGWRTEELLPRPFAEFVHPDDQAEATRVIEAMLRGEKAQRLEIRFRCRDGSYRTIQWSGVPDLQTRRIVAIGRDVTAQRQLQAELLQSRTMEAIGSLAGGIAHDFNNLMAIVVANARHLRGAPADDAERLEYLDEILESAKRAAELTRQLLSLSRRGEFLRARIDLNQVVREFTRLIRRVLPPKISLEFEPYAGEAEVEADALQLEQLLLNLCLNARDAMPEGGRIRLALEACVVGERFTRAHPHARPGEYLRLTVQDEGTGMSEEVRVRAFDPFFTTKPAGEGTGFGLATAYGVVQQHGGIISLRSEEGRGTTVEVYLPIAARAEAAVVNEPAPAGDDARATILVAEDERILGKIITRILGKAGYRTLLANDGREAVELFRAHEATIAMVVLDVVMPRLTGPEAYEQMVVARPGLPVLFSSGYHDVERLGELMPAGAKVLAKPYEPEDLLASVAKILAAAGVRAS